MLFCYREGLLDRRTATVWVCFCIGSDYDSRSVVSYNKESMKGPTKQTHTDQKERQKTARIDLAVANLGGEREGIDFLYRRHSGHRTLHTHTHSTADNQPCRDRHSPPISN